jgi:hypothetical protein
MTLQLMMDVHVRKAITVGLRLRGVDVLTAQEDHSARLEDPQLLSRSTELQRTLFSPDTDLLRVANAWQHTGQQFTGVIFAEQLGITIGQCIDDLELISKVYEPMDMANRVEFLPLK